MHFFRFLLIFIFVNIIGPVTFFERTSVQEKCGALGQTPCMYCEGSGEEQICGPSCKFQDYQITNTMCDLNRQNWKLKELDDSRGSLCGAPPKNCWRYDDEDRDRLHMSRQGLHHAEKLVAGMPSLPNGRYIFVHTKEGEVWISAYDRGDEYYYNRSDTNWRNDFHPCFPLSPGCDYKHVRHSQLNEGWDPLYCAGEMRIANGAIDRINNASGHFKPSVSCINDYLIPTLRAMFLPLSKDLRAGDFMKVNTKEDSKLDLTCPAPHLSHGLVCGFMKDGSGADYLSPCLACGAGATHLEVDKCFPEPIDTGESDALDNPPRTAQTRKPAAISYVMMPGACRGVGWNEDGWPKNKGYKTPAECKASCEKTPTCYAFDIARPDNNGKFACFLFSHNDVSGDIMQAATCFARFPDSIACQRTYTPVRGSCRGSGWDQGGWPKYGGRLTLNQALALCESTPGCTAFDINGRDDEGKLDTSLFGHASVIGTNSKVDIATCFVAKAAQ